MTRTTTLVRQLPRRLMPCSVCYSERLAKAGIEPSVGSLGNSLRQYLPKGADLSAFSQRDLDQIAWMMNTRPRKSLGYRTPAEIFFESCYAAKQDNH